VGGGVAGGRPAALLSQPGVVLPPLLGPQALLLRPLPLLLGPVPPLLGLHGRPALVGSPAAGGQRRGQPGRLVVVGEIDGADEAGEETAKQSRSAVDEHVRERQDRREGRMPAGGQHGEHDRRAGDERDGRKVHAGGDHRHADDHEQRDGRGHDQQPRLEPAAERREQPESVRDLWFATLAHAPQDHDVDARFERQAQQAESGAADQHDQQPAGDEHPGVGAQQHPGVADGRGEAQAHARSLPRLQSGVMARVAREGMA